MLSDSATHPPELTALPVSALDPSPLNARKTYTQARVEELATNIKSSGILQPLTVRPKANDRYEIVIGFRRFLAARRAGLERVPAIVRELTDAEVLEIMLAENLLREDLPPVEEAESFKALNQESGWEPGEIAAHTGKELTYVTERLRLADCPEETKAAIKERKLSLNHALLLVRLGDPEVITEATRLILRGRGTGKPLTVDETRQVLEQRYLLRLAAAPFPVNSALDGTGPCLECSKRASSQGALFPMTEALARDDRCLDRLCFTRKTEAHFTAVREAARADGTQVLTEAEARQRFSVKAGEPVGTDLNSTCYELGLKGIPYTVTLGERYTQHCRAGCPHFALVQDPARGPALTPKCFSPCCRKELLEKAHPQAAKARSKKKRSGRSVSTRSSAGEAKATEQQSAHTNRPAIARDYRNRLLRTALAARLTQNPAMLHRLALLFVLTHSAGRRNSDPTLGKLDYQDLLKAWGVPLKETRHEEDTEWKRVRQMPEETLTARLSQAILAEIDGIDPELLPDVAPRLGIEINRDFVVDEVYLKTRTKAELINLADELELADTQTLKNWERKLKRPEMIRAVLERWTPGKVPEEIRAVSASELNEEGKP